MKDQQFSQKVASRGISKRFISVCYSRPSINIVLMVHKTAIHVHKSKQFRSVVLAAERFSKKVNLNEIPRSHCLIHFGVSKRVGDLAHNMADDEEKRRLRNDG